MSEEIFKEQKIITQRDVENKQLKEENEKVESRKVESRKEENEKLRKNNVDAKTKESIEKLIEIKSLEEDKNKVKEILAIIEFKYIKIRDLVNNIRNNTISEIDATKNSKYIKQNKKPRNDKT